MGRLTHKLVQNRTRYSGFGPNLSTLSTEFSTFNAQISTADVERTHSFPISTFLSHPIHKPVESRNPGIPPRHSGVFHKFPTPYYGYYNKFNIDREKMSHRFWDSFLPIPSEKRRETKLNIICDKTLLSAAIDGVSKAVTLRSTIPVLEGILLKAEGFQLTLTGYDLEMGIVTTIEANVKEPGEIVLNAKLLSSMISRMPAGQITIQSADNGKTTIQSGVAQFEIQSMAATDFPELAQYRRRGDPDHQAPVCCGT